MDFESKTMYAAFNQVRDSLPLGKSNIDVAETRKNMKLLNNQMKNIYKQKTLANKTIRNDLLEFRFQKLYSHRVFE